YPGDSMAADKDEPMPIRLRMRPNINIGTEEEEWPIAGRPMTRATTDDSNSGLPTDEYGVFIIDEETYQNLVDRDASLAGYKTYGYVNEKAKLEGGELKREDGTYFVYPKAETQATSAYIFVYWPYHQARLTLTELMDGIEVSVKTDQSSSLTNSDVLAGWKKVSTTNGFKDVSSPASYPQLKMFHVMSHLTIAYEHTTAADETLSAETLSATLGNVHTKVKLNLFESLQNNSISVSDANTPNEIKLTPNEYSKTPVDNMVTTTFYALVPPQNIETSGANVTMTIINGAPQSSRNFYPSNSENAPTAWAAGKKYKYNYTYVTGE
ncbi:MAG: fimbrillin family protein, partial [Prevotella sp.]|nr:fimbrillin family protein [Prevotella sp.]